MQQKGTQVMGQITVYHKPTCSTCRQAVQLLKESGKPFATVNYYEQPFTKPRLKALLKKAGLTPQQVLRTKEGIFKELKLSKRALSDDELIDLMVKHPDLIQRPLVDAGETAILARPADSIKEVL
jgi:arsenate reductase